MGKMNECPICGSPANIIEKTLDYESYLIIDCYRCGNYKIYEEVIEFEFEFDKLSPKHIANISGWLRENQGSNIILTSEKIKSLMTLKNISVAEKADNILKYLAKEFPIAGLEIYDSFNDLCKIRVKNEKGEESWSIPDELLPIAGVGHIVKSEELLFIWEEYLIKTKKFISSERHRIITPAGWEYLESLHQANPDSKKAFVAMWFESEMEEIYDRFIARAIEDAGYTPIQIGRIEHNNDINDEIIGEIRSSKFVVADFTGNRGGVYFEAGFAYGQNIKVIHTCKENHLRDVHFVVNLSKIIKWKDGNDLYEQLLKRIKATIT